MKATIETLSHAKSAKDATMNQEVAVILSTAKDLVSASSQGAKQDASLSLSVMAVFPLTAIAAALLLLTPGVAMAVDECGPGPVVACNATTYANGITYDATSTLVVTKTNTGVTTVTNNGVNLTATGSAGILWDSTLGGVTGGTGTAGPVIDALTENGSIVIDTNAVTGTAAGVTHGIRARSTGNGAITITRTTGVVSGSNATTGIAGIEAVTNGGAINITAGGATNGTLRGIFAQTSGAGVINITTAGAGVNATAGIAAIETVAGTGITTINLTGSVNGGPGAAIRATSASTNASAVRVQGTTGTLGGYVDFSGVTAGGTAINLSGGNWSVSGTSMFTGFNDTVTVAAGSMTLSDNAAMQFGAGNDSLTVSSGTQTWNAGSQVQFGSGSDSLTLNGRVRMLGATIGFGGDAGDTMNFGGTMVMDGLTVQGVQTFNLSGLIIMGGGRTGTGNNPPIDYVNSDDKADDVLVVTGGTFTGLEGARILMDVRMEADSVQAGCATLTGAADCLDLRGASTAGRTLLTINSLSPGAAQGAYAATGITLVDVAGSGTSAAGHFALDPNSEGHTVDRTFGEIIARPGLIGYGLRYDAANQRHVLAGLPRADVLDYSVLGGATHSIWHMTAEAVTDRQADLRALSEGSIWVRVTNDHAKRDQVTEFVSFGETFAQDVSYSLDATTLMAGMDLVQGSGDGVHHTVGVQAGYVTASADLSVGTSNADFTGATAGLYGGLWSDRWYLDGALNLNLLAVNHNSFGLGSKTNTRTESLGAKAEGGYRLRFGEGWFAEPMATVAWVTSRFEELSLAGGEIKPDDATSLRGALGVRLGADITGEILQGRYFVTGRLWSETDGQSDVTVSNPGEPFSLEDEFSGTFRELEIGLALGNKSDTLSGFISAGLKDKRDYDAVNISAGFRLNW